MSSARRPITFAAAIATAVALGATAVAIGPASAAEVPLKDYELTWGIKKSFRDYVTGMAAGTVAVSDGAKQAENNGAFTFFSGAGTYDSEKHTVDLAFKGGVNFKSSLHRFDITLSDVQFDSAAGKVTADVVKNGTATQDVPLAEVTVSRDMKDMATKLTKEAADTLGSPSYEGAAGDPLTAVQGKPTTPTPDPTPTDKPTPTPTPTDKPTPTPTDEPTDKPTSDPSGAPGKDVKVLSGKLSWGMKESFRKYIASGGEVKTAGGAKKISAGYEFPYSKGQLNVTDKELDASFGGSVRFLYKAHGIDIKLSDLKIEAAGKKGILVADVTTAKGTNDDVTFATLDLSKASYTAKNDVVLLKKVPAAFTAEGAEQFANDTTGSMYKEGDPIDPLTVALSLSEDAQLPGSSSGGPGTTGGSGTTGGGSVGGSVGGSGSLASTGSSAPTGALLGAAGIVAAAGAGVVFAARRRQGAASAE
ncbi:HtaA domain-containing protein [Streptomyces sp. NBC_01304]|uniref:HtaA domain-containing protein n=1 Tax=Streptomyces sp. NBC_01304 TaxID=2903818 RepID=UPI002E110022|nr:HtaA domain-containing protein [Streptomyces sp. NBC_01304]